MSIPVEPGAAGSTAAAPACFRRTLVVANPIAGRGRAAAAAVQLSEALRRLGLEVELYPTTGRGDGARHVAERAHETDLVVSVGGDGTMAEVLSGLERAGRRDVPVAVHPFGTANVLALDLALPRGVEALVELVRAGTTRGLDVGHVNGRTSFLVTGVGIDGRIVEALEKARRGPISKATYVRHGVGAFCSGFRPPELVVSVDGETVPGVFGWVLVSNVVNYGGLPVLSADQELDDGLWEAYLFRRGTRASLLRYGLRGLLRRLPGGDCLRVQGRRVRVESAEPVPYQVDGDYGGVTPVEIEVGPQPFRILAP
jgi:YegS/Rv2252/BmrU family lipid kinase